MFGRRLLCLFRSVKPDPRASAAVACSPRARSMRRPGLGITARHLQWVVLSEVGLSPKTYQEIVRLRRFVDGIDTGAPLASAAASAGYADQAHLTRDIRRLCGLTPARLASERHSA